MNYWLVSGIDIDIKRVWAVGTPHVIFQKRLKSNANIYLYVSKSRRIESDIVKNDQASTFMNIEADILILSNTTKSNKFDRRIYIRVYYEV